MGKPLAGWKAVGSVRRASTRRAELRARRKPRLLFRFGGSFLLRFADRQFLASLFQLPPRFTRFEPCDHLPVSVVALGYGNAS